MMPAGPCLGCGATDYALSCGGPLICHACDCGTPPEVAKLRRELEAKSTKLMDYILALQVALGTRFYMTDQMRARGQRVVDKHLADANAKGFAPIRPETTAQ